MVSYFDSQHPAHRDKLILRPEETGQLARQIKEKKFTTLYAAPGYGKSILVNKALRQLKDENYPVTLITLDLFNITSGAALADLYINAFKKHVDEYNRDALLPIRIDFENVSTQLAINLPNLLSSVTDIHFVVFFKEFQNILRFEDGESVLKMMERELAGHKDVAYIVTGEQVNLMKEIFERQKFFYKINSHIELGPLEKRASMTYLRNGFLLCGKDLEEETGEAIYLTARGYPEIMNRLAAICDSLAIGYINKRILRSAVDAYFHDCEAQYRYTMSSLTDNQVNFLRAVCEGVQKFSSAQVLKKYKLNSSANVFRLKEALRKKEIVTFDSQDHASLIDPMFELWLKRRYFA